eukprot:CAMPEP_0197853366 /NCGR_PEP_ID=MMETSP1438-20131217/22573_1 /TAXON_ID=1461541 /ORGANISM="Pterosperma sp., Strain CCMP1384" /LENGTH=66 /DNA_ID=CAMNT_0043467749 /DNA_START=94 /DNA_END=294 /DNA_ORIENTATION=+
MLTSFMNAITKRNTTYVTFVLAGAIVGDRIVNAGIDAAWESNNQGRLYKHLEGTVIGGPKPDDDDE